MLKDHFVRRVYRLEKGRKALGLRKGRYVLACIDSLLSTHPTEIVVGRVDRRGKFFRDGDPARSWEDAPQGWGTYAYTHGDSIYRARCGLAHALAAAGYPDRFEYRGAVLVRVDDEEFDRVNASFTRSLYPYA